MNEEHKYLVRLLKQVVNKIYKEKRFLLYYSKGDRIELEQTFAFRAGVHFNNKIKRTKYKNLDLDSEYNKNQGNIKDTKHFPNGVRLDLLLHQRNSKNKNKMVAEFKGWWNNEIKNDIKKLKDLSNFSDKYRYRLGALVIIKDNKANYRYFIRGVEMDE